MILLGIDDTDTLDTPGTNQLARRIAERLPPGFECTLILRHQLFFDPRVPYTSQNGCASLLIRREPGRNAGALLPVLQAEMRAWYVPGSDPGLCLAERVSPAMSEFAGRCQREIVRQSEARALAEREGVHLEGFGGTEDGVIGALAGVALLAGGDDGRVVHLAGWRWPDPFAGVQRVNAIRERGVQEILAGATTVEHGTVDVGKHLRPNYRGGRVVLFVERAGAAPEGGADWRALKPT